MKRRPNSGGFDLGMDVEAGLGAAVGVEPGRSFVSIKSLILLLNISHILTCFSLTHTLSPQSMVTPVSLLSLARPVAIACAIGVILSLIFSSIQYIILVLTLSACGIFFANYLRR